MLENDIVAQLREQYGRMGITSLREAADEIERLRAERDAARREVCAFDDLDRLREENNELRGKCAQLSTERDEACLSLEERDRELEGAYRQIAFLGSNDA